MSEATQRISGFFTRKRNVDNSATRESQSDTLIPTIETTRASVEQQDSPSSYIPPPNQRSQSEGSEIKSFFRIPRRKKASSLSKNEPDAEKVPGADRNVSMDQPRRSFQSVVSPFEAILRPSLGGRTSSGARTPTPATNSAILGASTSLAAQASPRIEISNPLDDRDLTRQPSLRSIRSLKSTHSTPASDKSLRNNVDSVSKLPSRGRSLTYGGSDTNSKWNSNGRASKFFSVGRLLRDNDDATLFRPLSRELSPAKSPRKLDIDKPILPPLPAKIEKELPQQYLARIEARASKTLIASILASSDDPFHHLCLQKYMQQFNFIDDPLDIALRKFLMDTHLPKETQQIDRVLNAFSAQYQACNPRLYDNQVTPYVLSFALIMLHTDRFNQNNKSKMTKAQFIRNTSSEHTENVSVDILEYFYDNIVSTPFILVEDDIDSVGIPEQSGATTPNEVAGLRHGSISTTSVNQNTGTFGRKSLELYPLIMEDKLNSLRPQIGRILEHDYALAYTGTLPVINISKLHKSFTNPATLQLVSARSRPEAFASDHSIQNPLASDPGLVDIQITKIGILRRKEQKKAGSKPVFREWGVMLTPSQLLLFKNVAWVKHYMSQTRDQLRQGSLVLSPPVHNFSPDSYMPTSDTVAMYDASASKKPTHFCFFGRGGEQTHLIASSEDEMNDWVAKINYASAFHTIGVRIRGINAGQIQSDSIKRMSRQHSRSTLSTVSSHSASQYEATIARQSLMAIKIKEVEEKVLKKEQHLALLQQQARNLCTLTPIQPRTRTSVISAAGSLSAKLSWARMELVKTQCHRDILSKDLALELDPSVSAFTTPTRASTPPPSSIHSRTSPTKPKLGSVVGSMMRQVSSDTLKRVTRQFSQTDSTKSAESSLREGPRSQHSRTVSEIDTDYIKTIDLSPEALNGMFLTSPIDHDGSGSRRRSTSEIQAGTDSVVCNTSDRPVTSPILKLNTAIAKLAGKKDKTAETEDSSAISSASSATSPTQFILHGRKVSVVQTPAALNETSIVTDPINTAPTTSSVSSGESPIFQDASEHPFAASH